MFLYRRKPIRDIKHAFDSARTKAGITDLRFHDLRHCATTNYRKAGVDVATTMKIVGHKSTAMFQRYNNLDFEDLQLAKNKVEFLHANQLQNSSEVFVFSGEKTGAPKGSKFELSVRNPQRMEQSSSENFSRPQLNSLIPPNFYIRTVRLTRKLTQINLSNFCF